MAESNVIAVKIGADSTSFRKGAREAQDQTRELIDAMKSLAESMGRQRHPAKEAEDGIKSLTDRLREHKTELVQEARFTRFYAAEIANLGVLSKGAGKAVGELIAGFTIGGGIGAAIGAIKGIVEVIKESGEESKKQAEAIRENYKTAAETIHEALKKVRESFKPAKSETQRAWQESVGEVRKEIKKLQVEIDKLVAKGPGLKDFLATLFRSPAEMKGRALPSEEKIKELQDRQEALLAGVEGERPEKKSTLEAEKTGLKRIRLAKELNDRLQERHVIQNAENIVSTELWSTAVEQMHVEAETLRLKKEQEQADAQAVLDAERLVSPLVSVAEFERIATDAAKELEEEMRKQEAEAKKLAHELTQAAEHIGEAFGNAFKDMISGAKSVSDALQDLVVKMIEITLRMAALREMASGDFLGGAVLFGGSVIAGAFGSGGGGGGNTHVSVTNHFQGTQNESAVSLSVERSVVNAVRRAQSRGRL